MRVSGVIGYGEQTKIRPGVVDDIIVEKKFRADVVRPPGSGPEEGGKVNDDLKISVTLSVVAGAYHAKHVHNIRYITWQGERWKVSNVDVNHPRLIMRLGGLYHGPGPTSPEAPDSP